MKKTTTGLVAALALLAVPAMAQQNDEQVNLRVIHAVPGAPAVNLSIGNTSLFSNVEFKQITPFKAMPKQDDQTLKISLADGRTLETKEKFSFDDDDENYTILIAPDESGPNPKVVALKGDEKDNDGDDADEAEITLINASPGHKSLKVMLNDKRLEGGVSYSQAEDEDVKPGSYNMQVIDSSDDSPVVTRSLTVQGGQSISVVVMGEDAVKIINDDSPETDLSATQSSAAGAATTGTMATSPSGTMSSEDTKTTSSM